MRLALPMIEGETRSGKMALRRFLTLPVATAEPGKLGTDTCSYADLIALSDHEAMVVYSDFNYPDENGTPCKTILARKITIR